MHAAITTLSTCVQALESCCRRSKHSQRPRAVARHAQAPSRDSSNPPPTSSSDEPTLLHVRRHADGTIEYTFDPPSEHHPSSRSGRGLTEVKKDQHIQPTGQSLEGGTSNDVASVHASTVQQHEVLGADVSEPSARSVEVHQEKTGKSEDRSSISREYTIEEGTSGAASLAGIPPPRLTYGLLPREDVEAVLSPKTENTSQAGSTPPLSAGVKGTPVTAKQGKKPASEFRKGFNKACASRNLQRAIELVGTIGRNTCVHPADLASAVVAHAYLHRMMPSRWHITAMMPPDILAV